ncbi:WD40-repeat-containing domain protein [Pseudomassariella vexata]|uniref:WD40-repeat-containing domain protein n=1 Tax=Pseudomassariella vexata TaxID=1141098 RepID=A0A1Y2DN01_9PEZI|nr:WD40-repeat-containing domain protein [Pseudomassariella vexata]ORY60549.1 WD40-repeat-containing domain protein [Pseudomassariella vexata]
MSARSESPLDEDLPQYEIFVDAEYDDGENDPDYEDDANEDDEIEDDEEFHDAEEDAGLEIAVEVQAAGDTDSGAAQATHERTATQRRLINLITRSRSGLLNQRQIFNYLRMSNLGHLLIDDDDEDEDAWPPRRRRRAKDPDRFPKVPSEKGRELMNSGTFGSTDIRTSLNDRKRIARRVLDRELGIGNSAYRRVNQKLMAQSMIPTTECESIINYDDPVYSGQFSDDGNFFYAVVKDLKVRMYDTSNPYKWRHYKTVNYPGGSWTLTDASLSPDNKWLAYTTHQKDVCLAPTDPNDTGDPYLLDLGDSSSRYENRFSIFSIRFSGDGRELVAGTGKNAIIVYDIESRRVLHSIKGHFDDVNAVCFADKSSPHILYSGSDDTTIKVWDRRSMGDGREAGAFVGHIEGLTYIDSKGDGRYILSNGKDQSMKLWDLKMMYTTARFNELNPRQHVDGDFDYRFGAYDDADWFPHPNDNSVVTFRGHKVIRTLIRCHFSPPGSTDSRYVYSGSHDGKVYIYNMDATLASTIDVNKTTQNVRALPRSWRRYHQRRRFDNWSTCVRDASWHPNAPFIAASSLNGWDKSLGTVTVHSYNEAKLDEAQPRMGTGYNDKLRQVSPCGSGDEEEDDEYHEGEDVEDDSDNANGYGWRIWT